MKDTTFLLWRFEAIKICLYEIYLALALKVGVVLHFLATHFFRCFHAGEKTQALKFL